MQDAPLVVPPHVTLFVSDVSGSQVTTHEPTVAVPVTTIAPVTAVTVTDARLLLAAGSPG